MDTHADTTALGSNFVALYFTGQCVDVTPFSKEYAATTNIPVAQGATAYTDKQTGITYILIVNEGLWFGNRMKHSLINPNQLRKFGIDLCDDPFDPYRALRLYDHDSGVKVPFETRGSTVLFESRCPTQEKLDTCLPVVLTDDTPWDPQNVNLSLNSRSPEEEERSRIVSEFTKISSDSSNAELLTPTHLTDCSSTLCPKQTVTCMISRVQIASSQRSIAAVIPGQTPEDVPSPFVHESGKRHSSVSAEDISRRWGIGLVAAKQTLKVTTQRGVRSAILPLSRRYRTDRFYQPRRIKGDMYTDTAVAKTLSLNQNKYAQVFSNTNNFVAVYPMRSKTMAGDALKEFAQDFGIPDRLYSDGSKEQTKADTDFVKTAKKLHIELRVTEPERPEQNRAEGTIREVKKRWFRLMAQKTVPKRIWDFGLVYVSEIMQRSANSIYGLHGRCPLEELTGETPDITEYLDFGFYDWCWFKENAGLGPEALGRWLGVSHRVGNLMSYWILKENGQIVSRTTVQRIPDLELATDRVKTLCAAYDVAITERLDDANHQLIDGAMDQPRDWNQFVLDTDPIFMEEMNRQVPYDEDFVPEQDDFTPDTFDSYLQIIQMELSLAQGPDDEPSYGKVSKRLKDKDGRPIGVANDNPLLDTRMYEVEFQGGRTETFTANIIAENMFAQVDDEGHRQVLLKEVIDHRKDGRAVSHEDAFITSHNGVKRRRETTIGWELLVQWKDGLTSWLPLKDLKNSFPIEMAEYAVANKISSEPAFAWWCSKTLKLRNRIIAKAKTRYWLRTHKFGIKIPKNWEQAVRFDEENGDTLWQDAIRKEMKVVRPAFEVHEGAEKDLVGYTKITGHLIFDVKMGENFRRKARYVADGHKTDPPATLTYASVVSRDSVRLFFLLAALNDLKVAACDIEGAYLTADCREKIYIIAGPEFGSEKGLLFIIRKALYGLKSSGAAFRARLAATLRELHYVPTQADPDVWLRPATKPDGTEYYEYVIVYVDDIGHASHDTSVTMNGIQAAYKLKNDCVDPPKQYLGAGVEFKMINGVECWTMNSNDYVKAAITNVDKKLAEKGLRLQPKCPTPIASGYRLELDSSAELNDLDGRYYQELIGVLRWAGVELGRIGIHMEVSMVSTYLALPRTGHLEQVYHIFGYLKQNPSRQLAFDPRHPDIDERRFVQHDWQEFYRYADEQRSPVEPPPRGKSVSTHCFVDADHAGNKLTRRSQTGILLFVNRAPIAWYSKRHNSVEDASFGLEFVALRQAKNMIVALRYKLRSFGVEIEGPTNVFCDNEAVTKNVRSPESTLNKKSLSICYHGVREAVAAGVIRVAWENTRTNLADLLTKALPRVRREELMDCFMF